MTRPTTAARDLARAFPTTTSEVLVPDPTLPVDDDPADTGPIVRPFTEFLLQQAYGATHEELSQGLHTLLEAVRDNGKAGSLTLTIKVSPVGRGDERQVIVTDAVVVKKPAGKRPESFFFLDDDGNLTRKDPRQPELPLRDVARPAAAEAKAVSR